MSTKPFAGLSSATPAAIHTAQRVCISSSWKYSVPGTSGVMVKSSAGSRTQCTLPCCPQPSLGEVSPGCHDESSPGSVVPPSRAIRRRRGPPQSRLTRGVVRLPASWAGRIRCWRRTASPADGTAASRRCEAPSGWGRTLAVSHRRSDVPPSGRVCGRPDDTGGVTCARQIDTRCAGSTCPRGGPGFCVVRLERVLGDGTQPSSGFAKVPAQESAAHTFMPVRPPPRRMRGGEQDLAPPVPARLGP